MIDSGHDNPKSDMWFLASVFLVCHGIELGLKALLCRVLSRKKDVQDAFEECCHDVSMLLKKYSDAWVENFLTDDGLDKKGDNFRYPTSYSLEYRFDGKKLDLSNVYTYLKAIINFFESCVSSLDVIADYENEMKAAYEVEMINAETIEYEIKLLEITDRKFLVNINNLVRGTNR